MTVFIDTSAFIALVTAEDENHATAGATWRELVTTDAQLVTTNYTVVETCALLHRRFGTSILRKFVEGALPLVDVEWVDLQTHTAGLARAMLSARRGPSIVDCVSFAAMRRLNITAAFAFDPHFSKVGFTVLPKR